MSLVRRAWANFQPRGAAGMGEDISARVEKRGGERKKMGGFLNPKPFQSLKR